MAMSLVELAKSQSNLQNAYQQQLSYASLAQQLPYNGGYTSITGTGVTRYTLQWQPEIMPGDSRYADPPNPKHPDLAWLDKRVDEMRVKL